MWIDRLQCNAFVNRLLRAAEMNHSTRSNRGELGGLACGMIWPRACKCFANISQSVEPPYLQ